MKFVVFFGGFGLFLLVALWQYLNERRFLKYLERNHNETYKSLGEPTVWWNSSPKNRNTRAVYFATKEYEKTNDEMLIKLARRTQRGALYFMLFSILIFAALIFGIKHLHNTDISPQAEQLNTQNVIAKNGIDYNLTTTKLVTFFSNPNESYPERYDRQGFSEDGRKYYYNAYNSLTNKAYVAVNGVPGKEYDSIEPNSIGFYGDKLVYHAYEGERELFVVDEKEYEAHGYFDALGPPHFSENGRDYAYISEQEGKDYFVVNGKKSAAYDSVSISDIAFVDARHFKFSAYRGRVHYIVTSGNETPDGDIQFSENLVEDLCASDGRILSYMLDESVYTCTKNYNTKQEDTFIVINGQKSRIYNRIYGFTIVRSPDKSQLAYVGYDEPSGNWTIVLNGNEVATYHLGDGNENSISRVGFNSSNKLMYSIWRKNDKDSFFMDGQEFKTDSMWGLPTFSLDGKRQGYLATTDVLPNKQKEVYAVVDGVEQKRYLGDVGTVRGLIFSPDSKSYAYAASISEWKPNYTSYGDAVVLNGKEIANYGRILYGPVFSADSKFVMFGARKDNDIWWVVEPVQ
jgi:hypothetical protein